MLFALLGVVWLMIWVIAFIEILRRPDLTRGAKAGWALVVLLLPIVGVIVYLIARPSREERFDMESAVSADDRIRTQHPI